jgi:hypothetical protein
MIKTLRITGIIVAILAGILFVFPVVFGVRSDEQVEQLLNSPGVVEKFRKTKADKTATDKDSAGGGPLVKQAQAFALYLNPPQLREKSAGQSTEVGPRGPVEAKFTVIGTSFYAARPELSMAFIDEPGKGLRLIRQSSQVGHLVIEQIKDGLIVVRDGQRTFELAVQYGKASASPIEPLSRAEKSGLVKDSSSSPIRRPTLRPTSRPINRAKLDNITGKRTSAAQLDDDQSAALERLIKRLESLQKDKSDKIDYNEPDLTDESVEQDEQLEEIISDYQSERVSEEEAEKLNDLGEELQEGETE